MQDKKIFQAVHVNDLDVFLDSLGIKQDIESGVMLCLICNCKINRENLGLIFVIKGEIKICCNKPECYLKVNELRQETS
jgi:hypothetical protein